MFYGIYILTSYWGSVSERWSLTLFWPIYLLIWVCVAVPKLLIHFVKEQIKN